MNETINIRDIASPVSEYFSKRFGDQYSAELALLAVHASFPLALTVDLLYQLWANFKNYARPDGKEQQIPILAVSDLILSPLFKETRKEIYEMEGRLRTFLLLELKNKLGQHTEFRLASFLYQYVQANPGSFAWQSFNEAQQWTALLAVDPLLAAQQVLQALTDTSLQKNVHQSLGLVNLLESFSKDDVQFADFLRRSVMPAGIVEDPVMDRQELRSRAIVITDRPSENAIPVNVQLPGFLRKRLTNIIKAPNTSEDKVKAPASRVYALLVGIDKYKLKSVQLQQCVKDVNRLSSFLNEKYTRRIQVTKLTDRSATRKAIMEALNAQLSQASAGDEVLFYFAGNSVSESYAQMEVLSYNYNADNRTGIDCRAIRELLDQYSDRQVYVTLIFDTCKTIAVNCIDQSNPRHLVLCSNFYGELSYESESSGGYFTNSLLNALKENDGRISYRNLTKNIIADLKQQFPSTVQTACIFGNDTSWDRLFLLQDNKHRIIEIQELLNKFGYKVLPDGIEGLDTYVALQSFGQDYDLAENFDSLKMLRWFDMVKSSSSLQVSLIGKNLDHYSNDNDSVKKSKKTSRSKIDIVEDNPDVYTHIFQQGNLHVSEKGNLLGALGSGKTNEQINSSDFLFAGVNADILENTELANAVLKKLFLAKLNGKQTGVIIEEDCRWQETPFSLYTIFPSSYIPLRSDTGFRQIREELQNQLNIFSRFIRSGKKNVDVEEEEITAKIEEAQKTGKLDLSTLGLKMLPPGIEKLTRLTELNLSGNLFENVPEVIKGLRKITSLVLSRNPISVIPDWLYDMKNLEVLKLDETEISSLTSSVGRLKNLLKLDITNTKVEILPAELKRLPLLELRITPANIINVDPKILNTKRDFTGTYKRARGRVSFHFKVNKSKPLLLFASSDEMMLKKLRQSILKIKTSVPLGFVEKSAFNCVFVTGTDLLEPHVWFSLLDYYKENLQMLYYQDTVDNSFGEDIFKIMKYLKLPLNMFFDRYLFYSTLAGSAPQPLLLDSFNFFIIRDPRNTGEEISEPAESFAALFYKEMIEGNFITVSFERAQANFKRFSPYSYVAERSEKFTDYRIFEPGLS